MRNHAAVPVMGGRPHAHAVIRGTGFGKFALVGEQHPLTPYNLEDVGFTPATIKSQFVMVTDV